MNPRPLKIAAADAPSRSKPSNYPAEFAARMAGRIKKPLGDMFGLKNFGVNLTRLGPGAQSALLHSHSRQDEFVYVLEGCVILVTDLGEDVLNAGDCAGFPAAGLAHMLVNRGASEVVYLEIGDRSTGDEGTYPQDDLKAVMMPDGKWSFAHKDGRPY